MATIRALATALSIFLITGILAGQEGEKTPKKADENWVYSKPENGITLAASVPAKTTAGNPIPLKVELTNKGKEIAVVGINRRENFHVDIKLVDNEGKKVPLTRYGVKRLEPTEIGDILARANMAFMMRKLKPDSSLGLNVGNLGLFYDLTIPGDYRIVVSRGFGMGSGESDEKFVELKTPPLRFTIEQP
jgi:hypothetical protein